MATKLRLARGGFKKTPHYSVVAMNERRQRDGKFIEKIGHYHPLVAKDNAERLVIDLERAKYWLGVGAIPTEAVAKMLTKLGIKGLEKFMKTKSNPDFHKLDKKKQKELVDQKKAAVEQARKANIEKKKAAAEAAASASAEGGDAASQEAAA